MPRRIPSLLLLSTLLTGLAGAQSVTLRKIVDESTPVRGYGHSPALDGDFVAFLGEDAATGLNGIYRAPADGQGPLLLIVDQDTPLPNVPGESFLILDNPEIHEGVVTFTAGYDLSSTIKEGIYQGSGGPVSVAYDRAAAPFGPNPFEPIVEGSELVFRSSGADPSNFLTWSFPYTRTAPGSFSLALAGPMPGGGTVIRLQDLDDTLALGGGTLAVAAELNHSTGVDGGVYTIDLASGTITLVANWTTPMPGTATTFENFWRVDTDGSRVVFVGQEGNLGFGGRQGLYATGIGGGGLEVIAEVGDPAPGSQEPFAAFEHVAVEGDLVLFEAILGSVIVPKGSGIYGCRGGKLFKVLDSFDQLDGQDVLGATFDFRGLDGNRLALRVTFVDPAFPTLALRFGVYVATIERSSSRGRFEALAGSLPRGR